MNLIEVIERKFFCQPRNGDGFDTNLTDFTLYPQGEVIEKLKVSSTYAVSTSTFASEDSQIKATNSAFTAGVILEYGINWSDEGFVVGDTVRVERGVMFVNETITNVTGTKMTITDVGGFFATLGVVSGNEYPDLIVKCTTVPTSLIFQFGLPKNSAASTFYTSILDGQIQKYAKNGISAVESELDYTASNSSNLGSVSAKYITDTDGYIFLFEINHIFRIPHFISDWLVNYQGDTKPTFFDGSESIRYVSNLNFGTNISDPNNQKIFTDGFQLGSIGFLNENFNTGLSNYELVSASFTVDGSVVEKPEVTQTTVVNCQIKRNDGDFTSAVPAYAYHSRLPSNPADYSNNSNSYEDNFLLDQIEVTEGVAASSSTYIQNITTAIDGGDSSLLNIQFELIYSDSSVLSSDDWLFLGLAIENTTLSATLSDRTHVRLSTTQVNKSTDISGLITNFRPSIKNFGSFATYTGTKTWVNRAMEFDFSFDLSKSGLYDEILITSVDYELIVYDGSNYWAPDSYNFPLGSIPSIDFDGYPFQIKDISTQRFLSVPLGNSLRSVRFSFENVKVYQSTQEVTGKLGFIIPWRDWELDENVPLSFYDETEPPNFNRNKRVSNYSAVDGYNVFVSLRVNVQTKKDGETISTPYILSSDIFLVADFDEDQNSEGWSVDSFKIYNSSNIEVNEVDINGMNRVEWVLDSVVGTGGQNIIAEMITEPENNTGRHWRLNSFVDTTEDSNPLIPIDGNVGPRIVIDGMLHAVDCMIDGTLIDSKPNFYIHLTQ